MRSDQRPRGLRSAAIIVLGLVLLLPLLGQSGPARAAATQQAREPSEDDVEVSAEPVSAVCPWRFRSDLAAGRLTIPYCSNVPLGERRDTVERAVVVVHGAGRNAVDQYGYVEAAAEAVGAARTTIIVAPQFLVEKDVRRHDLTSNVLFWTDDGWKRGYGAESTSSHPRPAMVSSFSIVDGILRRLASRGLYPKLREIVIAGHSAGGQFVNRYAAGSRTARNIERDGLRLKYIVSNPSSYVYFNRQRRVPGTADQFAEPDFFATASCPSFHDYHYGLEDRNDYMSSVPAGHIKELYSSRRVVYLLGELDTERDDNLDRGCAARLQGRNRLARGKTYYDYLGHVFGSAVYSRHVREIVPGVAHDAHDIYNSDAGRRHLFEGAAPPAPTGVPAAPRDLIATTVGNSVHLSWSDLSNDEHGFMIHRCTSRRCTRDSFPIVATVGPDVTTYWDRDLKPDTSFGYRVSAYNSVGSSPPATISATTEE